jgi:hypothetical protein
MSAGKGEKNDQTKGFKDGRANEGDSIYGKDIEAP